LWDPLARLPSTLALRVSQMIKLFYGPTALELGRDRYYPVTGFVHLCPLHPKNNRTSTWAPYHRITYQPRLAPSVNGTGRNIYRNAPQLCRPTRKNEAIPRLKQAGIWRDPRLGDYTITLASALSLDRYIVCFLCALLIVNGALTFSSCTFPSYVGKQSHALAGSFMQGTISDVQEFCSPHMPVQGSGQGLLSC
jgi:hypothetical protein